MLQQSEIILDKGEKIIEFTEKDTNFWVRGIKQFLKSKNNFFGYFPVF